MEFLEIGTLGTKAAMRSHESGVPLLVFHPFYPKENTLSGIDELITLGRESIAPQVRSIRICLHPSQTEVQLELERMAYSIDGREYHVERTQLLNSLSRGSNVRLPEGFVFRPMKFASDIDAVLGLECRAHANDPTSRVSFTSAAAIEGMRAYYQRACETEGAQILENCGTIAGVIGLLQDRERQGCIHLSSASIDVPFQRKGLFLPFLHAALEVSSIHEFTSVSWVTTTSKLVALAEKHSIPLSGISLTKLQ